MVIVGIDEVGRGCWAGPLVAGAVILGKQLPGIRDSKKTTKRQREALSIMIHQTAAAVGIGWVSPQEVDALGLTRAVGLAMKRAISEITINYDSIIIDGNYNFFPDEPKAKALIKADDSVPAVSAASIVAKVARDDFMNRVASEFPHYDFDKHVGYGTAAHISALKRYGVTSIHRLSYKPIKALLSLDTMDV